MKFSTVITHKTFHAAAFTSVVRGTGVVAFIIILLCLSVPAGAETLAPTAKLIPPETVLLVDIGDFSKLRTQFEKTSFYRLYKDPAMAAFVDNFKTKWAEQNEKIEDEMARIIADVDSLPEGRLAVAMVLDERTVEANEPPFVLIAQWGKSIDKIKEAMNKIVEKAVEDGARRNTEDYRGVGITTMIDESSDIYSFCFIDDCLIGSMNLDVLKFVVAHIKGADSSTLANDDDYNATLRAMESGGETDGRINLYINIKHIIKMLITDDTSGQMKIQIGNLGLDNVTSLGWTVDFGSGPGGSSSGRAILKIDGAKRGICKILELESGAVRPPQFVSAEACSVSFINLDIKKSFDELANVLTRVSPQAAALLYMPLIPPSSDGEPAVQLKDGVIDYLGSQIIIAQSIDKSAANLTEPKPADMPVANAVRSLVAVAINNRNALEKSLSKLHEVMIAQGDPDAKRELLGHTIYLLDPSSFFPGFGGGPTTPMLTPADSGVSPVSLDTPAREITKLAFTITDTHLLFASEPVVEQAIRSLSASGSESVASKDWYRRAKSNVPSAVGLASFQDDKTSTEYLWSTIRDMAKSEKEKNRDNEVEMGVGIRPGGTLPELMLQGGENSFFDFTLLPEYDMVRKYFGLSAIYGVSRPDGFFFEFRYLTPESTD